MALTGQQQTGATGVTAAAAPNLPLALPAPIANRYFFENTFFIITKIFVSKKKFNIQLKICEDRLIKNMNCFLIRKIFLRTKCFNNSRPPPVQMARDVSNQRNDNLYLYSQSGVCLGYYLGAEASMAMENLMLSGQLESVLLSLFPGSSGPASHSSRTTSSSGSVATSSIASTSSSGYQSR